MNVFYDFLKRIGSWIFVEWLKKINVVVILFWNVCKGFLDIIAGHSHNNIISTHNK